MLFEMLYNCSIHTHGLPNNLITTQSMIHLWYVSYSTHGKNGPEPETFPNETNDDDYFISNFVGDIVDGNDKNEKGFQYLPVLWV